METLDFGIEGLDNVEQIGRGGSSRVYRATQTHLDREVALKVLKTAGDDPDVQRRFDRERRAMGRLSLNEGIVPVYSTGTTNTGDPYLLMPYYPDGSLQDRIDAGPVVWEDAVEFVLEAAETMAAAHKAGVVHLDLKPANILLSERGAPRIADFGIAKLSSDVNATAEGGSQSFTPTYSAPEILLGGAATPAADVYGLAVTLWALLAGRVPFRSDTEDNTLMAVIGRVVHQPIGDLRHIAPASVCSVIEIATAKDPADRYPTAGDFRRALAAARAMGELAGPAPVAAAGAAQVGNHDRPYEGADPGGLRFGDAVPPRLVPAADAVAPLTDFYERYARTAAVVGVAAVAAVALFIGLRAIAPDDDARATTSASNSETSAPDPTSGVSGALAGAGRSTTSDAESLDPAGPAASSDTTDGSSTTLDSTTSTTAETTSTTAESTTTTSESTTTTSASTTSTTAETTTTTAESTTTTSESTTTTSEDTTTTDPSSSTTGSSSTSSSSTTDTTETGPPSGGGGSGGGGSGGGGSGGGAEDSGPLGLS